MSKKVLTRTRAIIFIIFNLLKKIFLLKQNRIIHKLMKISNDIWIKIIVYVLNVNISIIFLKIVKTRYFLLKNNFISKKLFSKTLFK